MIDDEGQLISDELRVEFTQLLRLTLVLWFQKLIHVYIISCSHEVAKHKSGVICRYHLTVPPLATTLRKMVTQSVRMGKSAKIFKILVTFI
jgi:hypothetical protein